MIRAPGAMALATKNIDNENVDDLPYRLGKEVVELAEEKDNRILRMMLALTSH